MTKQAFIHELKTALEHAPIEVREEIVSDIHEHFHAGATQGHSEEDICRNLGQPGSIAAQVMEEWKNSAHANNAAYAQNSNGTRPQKDNDYSVSSSDKHNISIDKTFTDVSSVDVGFVNAEIHFTQSPNDLFRVVIQGHSKRIHFVVDNYHGKLDIKSKEPLFMFGIFKALNKLNATIYVPAQFMGEIKAVSTTGDITAGNISGNLKFETTAGNIIVDNHQGNKIKLSSTAGNLRLLLMNGYTEMVKMSTTAGYATLTAEEIGILKLETAAGTIDANVIKLGEKTKLSSSAGPINLTANEVAGNINASTAAGSIKIQLPKYVNCRIKVRKPDLGSLRNELVGNDGSPFVLKASTSVGSIELLATD